MIDRFEVRYDGKESTDHIIDARELAASLEGFSRILGTVYHYATTGEYVKKSPAQNVKVFVAVPEAKCYNILFELWELAKQQQVFQGLAGNVAVALVTYIVARAANRNNEMKHLAQALQTALTQNGVRDQTTFDRMLSTIEKMADALRPAVKQAVSPIGSSCETVRIGGESGITLDVSDKETIMSEGATEITRERNWPAIITELDRENATGKVRLAGDDEARVPISITDPAFKVIDSIYLKSFVAASQINLVGKAELGDGEIKRLYISNAH